MIDFIIRFIPHMLRDFYFFIYERTMTGLSDSFTFNLAAISGAHWVKI